MKCEFGELTISVEPINAGQLFSSVIPFGFDEMGDVALLLLILFVTAFVIPHGTINMIGIGIVLSKINEFCSKHFHHYFSMCTNSLLTNV